MTARSLEALAPRDREAVDIIARELPADGWRPAAEIITVLRAHGIAPCTYYRARMVLGVRSRKVGFRGAWWWSR